MIGRLSGVVCFTALKLFGSRVVRKHEDKSTLRFAV